MKLLRISLWIVAVVGIFILYTWRSTSEKTVDTLLVLQMDSSKPSGARLGLTVAGSNEFRSITPYADYIQYMGSSPDHQWFYYIPYGRIVNDLYPYDPSIITGAMYRARWGDLKATPEKIMDDISVAARWSPDHQWIVYPKTTEQGMHLFRSRADGSATLDLTPEFTANRTGNGLFQWKGPFFISSDSQWVYFNYQMSSSNEGSSDLYRVGLDGHGLQALTPNSWLFAQIIYLSPGGDWLLVEGGNNQNHQSYIMASDGTRFGLLFQSFFDIGPESSLIPLASKNILLFQTNYNDTVAVAISLETGQFMWSILDSTGIKVSPNEEWIYYYPADGTTTMQMKWDGTSKQERPELGSQSIVGWTSDGQSILFIRRDPTTLKLELRRLTSLGQDEFVRKLPSTLSEDPVVGLQWDSTSQSYVFIGAGQTFGDLSFYRLGQNGEYLKRYISWTSDMSHPSSARYSYIADGPMITLESSSRRFSLITIVSAGVVFFGLTLLIGRGKQKA